MKFLSYKIKDITKTIKIELSDLYAQKEIDSFIYLLFKEYLNFSKTDVILKSEYKVNKKELIKINLAINDLKNFKPIQYITGKINFYGLDFIVNKNVFIPRPETEELINVIINDYKSGYFYQQEKNTINILDIGTGSGCIAVTLKKIIANSNVFACDISKESLKTAKKNATHNNVKINFFIYDILNDNACSELVPRPVLNSFQYPYHPELLSGLFQYIPKFDIIISNPPYIRESEKKTMSKNILNYEPEQALFVTDENPLVFYNAIADFALKHLNVNGKIYFEINEELSKDLKMMLLKKNLKNIIIKKDINGKDRIITCSIVSTR
jgi:release factor glutamine methyltransferase